MDAMTEENVDLDRKRNRKRKFNQIRAKGVALNYLPNKQNALLNVFWKSAKLSCSSEVLLIKVQGGVNVYMRYEIIVLFWTLIIWSRESGEFSKSINKIRSERRLNFVVLDGGKQDMINKAPFLLIEPYEQYQVFMSMTVMFIRK